MTTTHKLQFLVNLYKPEMIFIDLYHQCVEKANKVSVVENGG